MTGSITHFSASKAVEAGASRRRVLAWLFSLGCLLLPVRSLWAADPGITIAAASLQLQDDRYVVSAQCSVTLTQTLEDVLHKGVPLYFIAEFELVKPRWYWAYRQMASWFDSSVRQEFRLSYHALTRKYRLARGPLQQNFSSLGQALAAMGAIRNWSVLEAGLLTKGRQYEGRLRLALNVEQLPKPLQVNFSPASEWELSSDWKSVSVIGNAD